MNHLRSRLLLPCTCVVAGLVLPQPMFAGTADVDTGKVFVGYVFRQPEKINFDLYTHLCHAFLVADEEGNVLPRRSVPDRDLTDEAHRAGVKVLLSLGGWGWDRQFATMVTKPDAEDRYVQTVMSIIDEYDYDGIDLDWEYPDTGAEVIGFERLARRFRRQLDRLGKEKGRPMLQTMAVSANPGTLKWLSNEVLLETMNWVNVMTYEQAVSIKTDWAMKEGFRGVFFWQIAADLLPDGMYPLQEASRKKWEENVQRER